jgi:hypothetical protein
MEIDGLNARQRQWADRLWRLDSQEQCLKFISTLPSRSLRQECRTVFEMMKWAALDDVVDVEQASVLLDRFRG